MAVPDETVAAHIPHATALIVAVTDNDPEEVERVILDPDVDLTVLCVLLASLVPDDVPIVYGGRTEMDRIVDVTAAHLAVDPDLIRSDSRITSVAHARQIAAWIAVEQGRTYSEVGRFLRRDHTTVMYAVEKVRRDPRMRMTGTVIRGLLDRAQGAA